MKGFNWFTLPILIIFKRNEVGNNFLFGGPFQILLQLTLLSGTFGKGFLGTSLGDLINYFKGVIGNYICRLQ